MSALRCQAGMSLLEIVFAVIAISVLIVFFFGRENRVFAYLGQIELERRGAYEGGLGGI